VVFEINDALGTSGDSSGWDLISLSGSLNITATLGEPFIVDLISLASGDVPGEVHGFDPTRTFEWTFLTSSGGISGFLPGLFSVNTAGFQNPTNGGAFSVAQNGDNLNIVFSTAVPEPSTFILASYALLGLGLYSWRRRKKHL